MGSPRFTPNHTNSSRVARAREPSRGSTYVMPVGRPTSSDTPQPLTSVAAQLRSCFDFKPQLPSGAEVALHPPSLSIRHPIRPASAQPSACHRALAVLIQSLSPTSPRAARSCAGQPGWLASHKPAAGLAIGKHSAQQPTACTVPSACAILGRALTRSRTGPAPR